MTHHDTTAPPGPLQAVPGPDSEIPVFRARMDRALRAQRFADELEAILLARAAANHCRRTFVVVRLQPRERMSRTRHGMPFILHQRKYDPENHILIAVVRPVPETSIGPTAVPWGKGEAELPPLAEASGTTNR